MADKNYLHTAYANSADGTDGFTTVYPNLNLLTDSKEFKNKTIAENAVDTSITSFDSTILKEGNETYLHFLKTSSNTNDWFRAYLVRDKAPNFHNINIKANTNYTFSVWLRGTGTHVIYAYQGWTEPWNANKAITLTKEWKLYTFTVLTRSEKDLNANKFAQFFIHSNDVGSEINLKKPKIEEGSTATPYMPSESEVKTADWPKYVGTYVDTNQTSSTEPSKYDWDEMKYRVYLDGTPIGGSKLLSFDLENLKAGTSYNVQVSQINGNVESDKSESVAFKTTLPK